GAYVFDTDGNRYLDGLSSLFCCQIGYSYGEEMAAVAAEQLSTLAFNTNWATAHPPAIRLAAALSERAPGDLNRVFITSAGAERRWLPRAARRLLGRRARALRPLRDRARVRRGDHRLRAHRRVVRRLALRRRAGPHHVREGDHVGVRADGRGAGERRDRRA